VAAAAVGRMALSFFPILLFSNCITTAPHVKKLFAKKNERDLGDNGGGDAYDDDLNQGWENYAFIQTVRPDKTNKLNVIISKNIILYSSLIIL